MLVTSAVIIKPSSKSMRMGFQLFICYLLFLLFLLFWISIYIAAYIALVTVG